MMWPIYISYFTARLMDPGFFSIVGIVGCAHLDTGYPRRSLSGSRKTSAWRASRIFIRVYSLLSSTRALFRIRFRSDWSPRCVYGVVGFVRLSFESH